MNEISQLITSIGDLQVTLENGTTDEEILLRLNRMRRTALTMLEGDNSARDAAASYRKEAIDRASSLGSMLNDSNLRMIPDSTLFRLAAAADAVARATHTYLNVRNLLAAEQARIAKKTEVYDG